MTLKNYLYKFLTNNKLMLFVMLLFLLFTQSNYSQQKSIILGRPTNNSVTASILFDQYVQFYLEYGLQSGTYTNTSVVYNNTLNVPDEIDLTGLAPNSKYFYRMQYKLVGATNYVATPEYHFQTQRAPGSNFTFTVIIQILLCIKQHLQMRLLKILIL